MSTTYNMKLASEPFSKIKDGTKLIELRLFDDKRKVIELGDHIVFASNDDSSDTVEVKVQGILRYNTFSDLIDDFPAKIFGHDDKADLKQGVYRFYTPEKESENGVLGIRIQKV